ncbi:MAG: hypothetical protein AAF211_08125 [Myxococcota bacterium]
MLFAAIVVLIGALELWSLRAAYQSWQAIQEGTAERSDLADFTGVHDPLEIDRRFGPPDAEGIYSVDADQLERVTSVSSIVDHPLASVGTMILVCIAVWLGPDDVVTWWLLGIALSASMSGVVSAIAVAWRYSLSPWAGLAGVTMPQLPVSLGTAREQWGESESIERGAVDGAPYQVHEFMDGFWVEIRATVWRGGVHRLVYRSARSDPARDLEAVLLRHGEGQSWVTVDGGHRREDGGMHVTREAASLVTVTTDELRRAEASDAAGSSARP